jgi:MSHA biogenesis protein MshO
MTMTRKKSSTGFTLIEMILVIVITGIIAGVVAVFLRTPVESYFSTVRRAKLTEEADSALRFVARDLQAALPNSIACTGSGGLTFLSILSGGRYREDTSSSGAPGTPLQFGSPTMSTFDMIGTGTSVTKDANGIDVSGSKSMVVVGNLSSGVPTCNSSYSAFADNAAMLAGISGSSMKISSFVGGVGYPLECNLASAAVPDSPVHEVNNREFGRLYVVNSAPVKYLCDTTNGLTKNGILIVHKDHLNACKVACDSTKARVQLVTFNLTLMDQDNAGNKELVTLLRRVTVVNTP